jgi:hypothetical protein
MQTMLQYGCRTYALFLWALLALAVHGADLSDTPVQELTKALWPRERILQAVQDVQDQKNAGLLTLRAYEQRMGMLRQRLEGSYPPRSLSEKNRSRWLWWNGWSWGGDYENMWEEKPEFVHSGKFSARIRCTGAKGRIGINAPPLPVVPGASEYKFSFWARGEGANELFVNFEEGATGEMRQQTGPEWRQYTVVGKPVAGKNTFTVYFYSVGEGTIWLDDVSLIPVGGEVDE